MQSPNIEALWSKLLSVLGDGGLDEGLDEGLALGGLSPSKCNEAV